MDSEWAQYVLRSGESHGRAAIQRRICKTFMKLKTARSSIWREYQGHLRN